MHQLNQPVGRATNTGLRSVARRYGRSVLLSAALVVGGGLLAIGVPAAPAAAVETSCRVVATNGSPLNIRSAPNSSSAIMSTIAKGRTLEVIGSGSNGWMRVRATVMTGGSARTVEGWAASSFLRPCTAAQNPQTPTPIPANLCRRVVYNEGLSVHEQPDLTSTRTGGVPVGDQVQLVNRESTSAGGAVWMQINRPVQGWIPVRSLNRPTNQLNVLNCL